MRGFPFAVSLLAFAALTGRLQAQSIAELQQALVGSWAGTLEYRDFSEPAASTKRVKLPTWLRIESAGAGLRFSYVYDDGPAKTVTETSLVRIDPVAARYAVLDAAGKLESSYAIAGLAQLKQGRGSLTLTGPGTENQVAVDVRTTIRIGRNILEITRETAAPGQTFTFRHAYTLVRAAPPTTTPAK
jgi:hypothetical protein